MKRLVIVLVVLMALVCWYPGSQVGAAPVRDNMVLFSYFVKNANWWTGLAVLNYSNVSNSMLITVFNSSGVEVASGNFNVGAYDQRVDLIENFIEMGVLPATGYIVIEGSEHFYVDKFTGNLGSQGGFSEVEKESVPLVY